MMQNTRKNDLTTNHSKIFHLSMPIALSKLQTLFAKGMPGAQPEIVGLGI